MTEQKLTEIDHSSLSAGRFGLITYQNCVQESWLDVNRHMNVSHYDKVFDQSEHVLFMAFGIGEPYTHRTNRGVFRLEKHISYRRELLPDMAFTIQSRVHWTDEKRIRHFHVLIADKTQEIMATNAVQSIHVDLTRRRSAVITDEAVLIPLRDIYGRADDWKVPEGIALSTG